MADLNDEIFKCEKKLAFYINRWKNYPLSFHIEALQADKFNYPTLQQYEMCNIVANSNFLAIRAGRGVGKSTYESGETARHLICYKNPGVANKVIITGPSASQVGDVCWGELSETHKRMLPYLRDKFELTQDSFYCKESPDSWSAMPRTARPESPGSMFGIHGNTKNIYDEAPYIADSIFKVSVASFTQSTATAIMSGNPDKLSGYFFRVFNTQAGNRWAKYHIDCYDCLEDQTYEYPYIDVYGDRHIIKVKGLVTRDWIQDQIDTHGEFSPMVESHVRGNFPLSELNQMVQTAWIERCWKAAEYDQADRKRILGFDPGEEGDPSAYCIRKGNNIEEVEEWQGQDPMQSSILVKARFDELKASNRPVDIIVVDANGIGSGVAANLIHWKYPVIKVKSQESCPKDMSGTPCRRMRDWMGWQCRNFYRDSRPKFCEETPLMKKLAKELGMPSYRMENGKVVLQSKKEMKNLGYDSPNLFDAHNLTFKADWKVATPKPQEKEIDPYRKKRLRSRRRRGRASSWKTS